MNSKQNFLIFHIHCISNSYYIFLKGWVVLDAVNEEPIEIENDDVQKQSEKDENLFGTSKDNLKDDTLNDGPIGKIGLNKT